MKKNAFTLVELLAVITILSLIAAIVFPSIIGVINNSKKSAYESQKKILIKAAKEYYLDNSDELPEMTTNSATKKLTFDKLINGGYISQDEITNQETGKTATGCITVTYSSNNYSYFYEESAENCQQIENN